MQNPELDRVEEYARNGLPVPAELVLALIKSMGEEWEDGYAAGFAHGANAGYEDGHKDGYDEGRAHG